MKKNKTYTLDELAQMNKDFNQRIACKFRPHSHICTDF